jgi:2-dehydropantoate 2-reductase
VGAIGGSLAHYLSSRGHAVTAIDVDETHVAAISANGLTLVGSGGVQRTEHLTNVFTQAEADQRGLRHERVLLATKAQHVSAAAEWLAPSLTDDALVVLCQNRETIDDAEAFIGRRRIAGAFVNFAADVVAPGIIRSGGPGEIAIGDYSGGTSTRVSEMVVDLADFGSVAATSNISGFLWAKRGIAAILTATALVDEHVSVVIDTSRPLMAELATEVYRISDARGVVLETIDGIVPRYLTTSIPQAARDRAFDRLVSFTGGMVGKERTGVFRDIAVRHRPTEARPDLLALSNLGQSLGLPTPYIDTLARLIGELEAGTRTFGRHNLVELAGRSPATHVASPIQTSL